MQGLGQLPGIELLTFSTDPDCSAAKQAADWRNIMPVENNRTTIGHFIWKRVVGVMLSLQVIVMLAFGRNVFVAKEALVVILLVAISMAVILLLVVAVFLIQAGIRRGVLWMTIGILWLAKLHHRHVGLPHPIIPPPL